CISGKKLYKHAEEAVRSVERLEKLIFFDDDALPEGERRATSLGSIEEAGAKLASSDDSAFEDELATVESGDLATIIYTSGTTGEPKGVMLTHNNFISNVMSIGKGLPIGPTDVALSVLPLSHIFERDGFYVFLYCGVSVHYSPSFDQVGENLREVAPTVMTAV